MKLSIVIASWNVREHLRYCLASLFAYPSKESLEVIVVDNASSDGSVDMVRQEFPQVNLIANEENKGFSTANNQGIRHAKGEYILVLNDDTQIKSETLDALIAYLDTHPDVGVVGPKILNPDGSIQPSVRRLPTFWSQLLFVFSKLAIVQRYFWHDFDYEKEQEVPQIMGACMMIRASVLEKVGLFDEKFFVWFEEVDLCARIKESDNRVMYTPSAEIIHEGGSSFAQYPSLSRFRNYSASCKTYMYKHKGFFAWLVLAIMYPVGFVFVWLKNQPSLAVRKYRKIHLQFWVWISLLIAGVEVLSFVGWSVPTINSMMFWIVGTLTLILGLYHLPYAGLVVLAELIIGSKGGLFAWSIGDNTINVRIIIFIGICLAWFLKYVYSAIQTKTFFPAGFLTMRKSVFRWWYVAMGVIIIAGTLYGWARNDVSSVFADANAWYYFFIAPVLYDTFADKGGYKQMARLICVAIALQITKTLSLVYLMSHPGIGSDLMTAVYRWVRDTGVGEITLVSQNVYRTFLQSQIYLLPFFLGILAYVRWGGEGKSPYMPRYTGRAIWVGSLIVSGIIISQSRSLGVALVCSGVVLAVLAAKGISWKRYAVLIGKGVCMGLFALVIIIGVIKIPFFATQTDVGVNSVKKRFESEAAVGSRWSLLPVMSKEVLHNPLIGYGFGKTLTYISQDPRVLENDPSGTYTTYAFEWGYLDILLKLGLVGLIVYALFFLHILYRGWKAIKNTVIEKNGMQYAWRMGIWLGLIALAITHFFTPYLNHPLGIAYLIMVGRVFDDMV
ncbi:MAG: glycosyltransferase [bacterium]|nr:glycosyltransferase [bacterium]